MMFFKSLSHPTIAPFNFGDYRMVGVNGLEAEDKQSTARREAKVQGIHMDSRHSAREE